MQRFPKSAFLLTSNSEKDLMQSDEGNALGNAGAKARRHNSAERENKMKNKPTFESFLRSIYGMSMVDYEKMPRLMQKAVEVDYIDRYGKPIVWW